jgi:hypothetical protein
LRLINGFQALSSTSASHFVYKVHHLLRLSPAFRERLAAFRSLRRLAALTATFADFFPRRFPAALRGF